MNQPEKSVACEDHNVQPHDFRTATILSPRELRGLRQHQGEFVRSLATRLSLFVRLEASAKLTALQTTSYQKLAQSWANPSHLTLFKIEPLRGVGVLEISPALGSAMVDRLMGGTGSSRESAREFSEIEKALLEQAAQLVLNEWCGCWRGVKELKPTVLGQETNGRYVQAASPDTIMLVVAIETNLGNCTDKMQIAVPYAAVENLIRQLSRGSETAADAPVSVTKPLPQWNSCFDDVCVPVNAEWEGLEMSARDLLGLKVGDVLRLDPKISGHVQVRVAEQPRFNGRPGTVSGKWAVELTQTINH